MHHHWNPPFQLSLGPPSPHHHHWSLMYCPVKCQPGYVPALSTPQNPPFQLPPGPMPYQCTSCCHRPLVHHHPVDHFPGYVLALWGGLPISISTIQTCHRIPPFYLSRSTISIHCCHWSLICCPVNCQPGYVPALSTHWNPPFQLPPGPLSLSVYILPPWTSGTPLPCRSSTRACSSSGMAYIYPSSHIPRSTINIHCHQPLTCMSMHIHLSFHLHNLVIPIHHSLLYVPATILFGVIQIYCYIY